MTENKKFPDTISESINILLSSLSIEDKQQIKDSSEDELINFHFGLGMSIRNDFGLWDKNSKLFEDCKKISGNQNLHVDDASEIIIKSLWERLQKFPPPELVKQFQNDRP